LLKAVALALSQMFSPPFRAVLLKAVALAFLLIALLGVGAHRLFVWLASFGEQWIENAVGGSAHTPIVILAWIFSIAAGLGIVLGSVLLMPAVTALVGSFFVDEIALEVEREHYPTESAGTPLHPVVAVVEGSKTALLSVFVYLIALPFLLLAGLGAIIFFIATAYLLGREYFELAAMRFHPIAEAKWLRRANQSTVFVAGLCIAAFVAIPIVNLATPLFGMALMVHVHKNVTRPRLMRP
jgi:CysZ protein